MRRLMQTIIALPSIASSRSSKCSTRSSAISSTRFSAPTIASSRAHLLLSFSLRSTSSPSVTSSNSSSILGLLGLVQLRAWPAGSRSRSDRRPVLDGALDVVDVDVVAEDRPRVVVGLSRSACR